MSPTEDCGELLVSAPQLWWQTGRDSFCRGSDTCKTNTRPYNMWQVSACLLSDESVIHASTTRLVDLGKVKLVGQGKLPLQLETSRLLSALIRVRLYHSQFPLQALSITVFVRSALFEAKKSQSSVPLIPLHPSTRKTKTRERKSKGRTIHQETQRRPGKQASK